MTFGCWHLVYRHRSGWIPEICGALAKSLLPYFFFCPNAPAYVFEGLESFYLNIREMLQHRIELNAKEAQGTVTAFQVARFLLCTPLSPLPFAFAFTFLARGLHKARPRSGIVLLIHITVPGPTPSHLTAPMGKRLRNTASAPATTDQQVSVGTHEPLSAQGKNQVESLPRTNEDIHFSPIFHSLVLAHPPSITAN